MSTSAPGRVSRIGLGGWQNCFLHRVSNAVFSMLPFGSPSPKPRPASPAVAKQRPASPSPGPSISHRSSLARSAQSSPKRRARREPEGQPKARERKNEPKERGAASPAPEESLKATGSSETPTGGSYLVLVNAELQSKTNVVK